MTFTGQKIEIARQMLCGIHVTMDSYLYRLLDYPIAILRNTNDGINVLRSLPTPILRRNDFSCRTPSALRSQQSDDVTLNIVQSQLPHFLPGKIQNAVTNLQQITAMFRVQNKRSLSSPKKKTHNSLQSSTTKFGNNSAVVFRLILRHLPNFFLFFFLLWLLYYSKGSHGMSPSVAEYETCFFFWPAFTLLIIQPTGQQSRNRKKNE